MSISDYNTDGAKQLIADFSVAANPAPGHEESYIFQGDMYLVARDSETNKRFFAMSIVTIHCLINFIMD